jgi:hypothetical protein
MNVRESVCEALKAVGAPVLFQAWQPVRSGDVPPETYITFTEMLNQPELCADGSEWIEGRYIALDIWSAVATEAMAKKVRSAMRRAGWIRRDERDLYEEDTKTFHRAMAWVDFKEVNEDE